MHGRAESTSAYHVVMTVDFSMPPGEWLSESMTATDVGQVIDHLTRKGTFLFPQTRQGLFPAAFGDADELRLSGYHHVWTRDTVHIAHALWEANRSPGAIRAMRALARFYSSQADKMLAVIEGRTNPEDVMARPSIRFDGTHLRDTPERWPHAQNDALGYFLWFFARLALEGGMRVAEDEGRTVSLLVQYLSSLPFWADEDSGHWEEMRRLSASSIGVVVAGLSEVRDLAGKGMPGSSKDLDGLARVGIEHGRDVLRSILPSECVQPDPRQERRYDAALVFLVEPVGLLKGPGPLGEDMGRRIVNDVVEHLTGPWGIKRYIGDSYWSADYRLRVPAAARAAEVSADTSQRDADFVRGTEAQWCVFDSTVSACHGRWYAAHGRDQDRRAQVHHLRRALAQLVSTPDGKSLLAPEAYCLERGRWVPNDQTPLLWSAANLLLGLHVARLTSG